MALRSNSQQSQDQLSGFRDQELDLESITHSLELHNSEFDQGQRRQREFLAEASHELRIHLNAILSFLRLVLDGLCDSPEESRHFVQNAYDSARSLLDLINERLIRAEIEAGKMDLQLTEVNVAAIFSQVEKLTTRQADQKKVRLTVRFPKTRVLVRADPVKFSQVLLNLVANAVQALAKGEVRVQARSWRDYGHVQFQVKRIAAARSQKNKDSPNPQLHQDKGAVDLQENSSSMGISACKNLVECMGGQIWPGNHGPGKAASVFFTLPLVTPQPLYWRRTTDRERGLKAQGPSGCPLILMVEDEPKVLNQMARILHKHEYRTAYAVTADDGLEGAKRLRPALITIDLGLPVRPLGVLHSGMDLYRALKEYPQVSDIPVIFITGHDPALTQPPQELPPILSKPLRAQELLDQVAKQLTKKNRVGA
ncbi:MAG: response regulator [Thermodesulfobacteriota bacterium]